MVVGDVIDGRAVGNIASHNETLNSIPVFIHSIYKDKVCLLLVFNI